MLVTLIHFFLPPESARTNPTFNTHKASIEVRNINRLARGICQVWKLCIPKVWRLTCTWFDFPMPSQRGWSWDREGSVETTTLVALTWKETYLFFFFQKRLFPLHKLDILHLQSSRLVGRHAGAMPTRQQKSRWFKPSPNNHKTQTVLFPPLQPVHRVSFFQPQWLLRWYFFKGRTKLVNLNSNSPVWQ